MFDLQGGVVMSEEHAKIKSFDSEQDVVVCRCEEISREEIRDWIARGFHTLDELKRVLRIGMGPCQGRGCRDIVMRELACLTGKPLSEIAPGEIRPPVKPIKLALLAQKKDKGGSRDGCEDR